MARLNYLRRNNVFTNEQYDGHDDTFSRPNLGKYY